MYYNKAISGNRTSRMGAIMFSSQRSVPFAFLLVLLLVACAPSAEEPAMGQAPLMGSIVPFGVPEVRDLAPTSEVVPNCNGDTSPVIKNPSITTISANTVEWQVGGSVGTGLTIGQGIVPAGIDLQAALEGHVATDITNMLQHGNAWELPADPGTIREYTIMWRETWQPAYIDVTFMDPEPQIIRIDVKYRTGIQSDIVGDKVTRCDLGATTQAEPVTAQPSPVAATQSPPTAAPDSGNTQPCPFLTNSQIEQLRSAASVSDALQQAEEFAGHQQNDYREGSTIPAGVVIATDLQNSDLSAFPVSPVRNQGGWGLFVTTGAFAAPNAGTYWCIQ